MLISYKPTASNSLFCFSLLRVILIIPGFFASYRLLQFRAFQSALEVSDQERLKLLGDSVQPVLLGALDQVGEDPAFLYDIAVEKNLKRIILADSDGTLLADSHREIKTKEKIPSGKGGAAWRTALAGEIVTETAEEASGEFVGKIWLPLNGRAAQLLVALPSRTDPKARLLLLFMNVFGVMGAGMFGYYFLRLFMVPSPSYFHAVPENPATETGFVIHTFQGLIQQLKQKEQALEQLKEGRKNTQKTSKVIMKIFFRASPAAF
ncbi:MAG: hypothetical protein MPW14_21895 [Candidatus Manganitrophus sp.]|nr:MAG: hypothetical protein MPW14_21895 [Candidatus Manganitrophus sp.]